MLTACDHGFEACGEVLAAHGHVASGEEDDVFGHQIQQGGEIAVAGGFGPGVDEGADLLLVCLRCSLFGALLKGGEDDVLGEEFGEDVGVGVCGLAG